MTITTVQSLSVKVFQKTFLLEELILHYRCITLRDRRLFIKVSVSFRQNTSTYKIIPANQTCALAAAKHTFGTD